MSTLDRILVFGIQQRTFQEKKVFLAIFSSWTAKVLKKVLAKPNQPGLPWYIIQKFWQNTINQVFHPKLNQMVQVKLLSILSSRYILQRVGEDFGVVVTFDPKVKRKITTDKKTFKI